MRISRVGSILTKFQTAAEPTPGLRRSLREIENGETRRRARRWRIFLYMFSLLCIAIGLDVISTYLGIQRIGWKYEQNGIALHLIQFLGWPGLICFLALACAACVMSFKRVYWKLNLRWSLWLNILVAIICLFRWLVAVLDFAWLFNGGK